MKSNDFLNEGIGEDAQAMAQDHEVQMARQECYHAAEDAITLHKLLRHMGEQQGLEGWVSAKITLAADYLNTVREHLEYQLMSGAEQQEPINVVTVAEDAITHEDLAPVVEATDMMAKERKKRLADAEKKKQERLAAEKAKKDKKQQGVAEGKRGNVPDKSVMWHDEQDNARVYHKGDDGYDEAKKARDAQKKRLAKKGDGKLKEGEVYDLEKEYGYEKPKAQPKRASVPPTRPSLHPEDTDFMDPVERRLRADQARVKAAWAAHNAKKGVEEGHEPNVVVKFGAKEYNAMSPEQKAAKQNEWQQLNQQAKKRGQSFTIIDSDKEQGVEENAGSVATVVNPTPKNKAKVGTLFGGTYKQKKAAK